ncbi:unnamed protein product (macronuclear) [Paramecium tetraurelia]|uniref:Uncharacterized protein n=1 Tax=Paramecium tetraurelia TaxID=5888 RepID=A0D3D2_PARTE|nr:uncharacterized protein GSPATT00013035001 [Paramecium tetraurelia]CAK77549.1 unnamed protein product [Paramecium tetraurelia]|eukprot:XP_001444946.1 hypothetical protein (macronuclear) [Paramecium tetraurelia strain d4-2]
MQIWKLLNQKILFQYARQIKPRIPIQIDELNRQFEQQKLAIREQAEKQIRHAHSIAELISLNNDVSKYVDVTEPMLKRLSKLKITSEEFSLNQEFIAKLVNNNTSQLMFNLLQFYENDRIEKMIFDAYKNKQLSITQENNLRLLQIIVKHGQQQDLEQWSQNWEFQLNGKNISKFYSILDSLEGKLPDREIIVNKIEQSIYKYTHQYDYETIYKILKYRSFNEKVINEDLLIAILRRLYQIELNLEQLTNINQYLTVELQYLDAQWLNQINKSVLQQLYPNQQLFDQIDNNLDDQEEEIIQKNTENNTKRETKTDINSEVKNELKEDELLKLVKDLELRTEPFKVTDIEKLFLKLMDQLSKAVIVNDLNLIALSFFKELDVYMMQFLNHLTPDEQLICFKFHAKFIETIYNEQSQDPKQYKKSCHKKLEQMNNSYYEITLQCLKELNFEQTLTFLEAVSVLGVSKRKVCQKIMKVGFEGLQKLDQCKLENHKKNYALFAYYKLLQLFITQEQDILKIEKQFQEIKINTLDLQTEYSHLGVKRQKIQELENQNKNNEDELLI